MSSFAGFLWKSDSFWPSSCYSREAVFMSGPLEEGIDCITLAIFILQEVARFMAR